MSTHRQKHKSPPINVSVRAPNIPLMSKHVFVLIGIGEHQQSEWNPARGSSSAGDRIRQTDGLPVHHPQTAGSAGRADQSDRGGAFLEQYGSFPGSPRVCYWTIRLVQVIMHLELYHWVIDCYAWSPKATATLQFMYTYIELLFKKYPVFFVFG